jgi:hypothetical protein
MLTLVVLIDTNVIKGAAETCCMAWLVSTLMSQPTAGLWIHRRAVDFDREDGVFN